MSNCGGDHTIAIGILTLRQSQVRDNDEVDKILCQQDFNIWFRYCPNCGSALGAETKEAANG